MQKDDSYVRRTQVFTQEWDLSFGGVTKREKGNWM